MPECGVAMAGIGIEVAARGLGQVARQGEALVLAGASSAASTILPTPASWTSRRTCFRLRATMCGTSRYGRGVTEILPSERKGAALARLPWRACG